jgi:hypothetical protein
MIGHTRAAYPMARRAFASFISSLRLRAYSLEEISKSFVETVLDRSSGDGVPLLLPALRLNLPRFILLNRELDVRFTGFQGLKYL